METTPIINTQKNKFSGFWHKKVYSNTREKSIDFFVGLIFTPVLFFILNFFIYFFQVITRGFFLSAIHDVIRLFFGYSGYDTAFIIALLLFLLTLTYSGFMRKYFFFGMLVGWFVLNLLFRDFMSRF